MPLNLTEIKERHQKPKHKNEIGRAAMHEDKVRLHSEPTLGDSDCSPALASVLAFVKTFVNERKYDIFCNLIQYPIETIQTTDEVYSALEKIFDGQNPVIDYEFTSDELAEDWEQYQKTALNYPNFWRETGFEVMKNAINSIIVADLAAKQITDDPEPYLYFLDFTALKDFEPDAADGNGFEWIMFENKERTQLHFYDAESYRVFPLNDSYNITGEAITDNPHDLGSCPARFFWSEHLSRRQPHVKRSPLSHYLSTLDWLFVWSIARKHVELYEPFAVTWSFHENCDYSQPYKEDGETIGVSHCSKGFLRAPDGNYLVMPQRGQTRPIACPKCSGKKLNLAGTHYKIAPPSKGNDQTDLRPPMGKIKGDIESLKWIDARIKGIQDAIFQAVTGNSLDAVNDQAVNEKQVMSLFESRKAALVKLKENFEKVQKWADETVCKLRYGLGFVSCVVNYGTEFFIFNADMLLNLYAKARKEELPDDVLDYLQSEYYQTKFRNNREQLMRAKILSNLDPFRHMTRTQVQTLKDKTAISFPEYMLKINFSSFVRKFERENVNILQFGKNLSFDKKINNIRETLLTYVVEPEPMTAPATEAEA